MATNNAIDLSSQGVTYYDGVSTFSGLDGISSGYVLTSNGTGVAPSFQSPYNSFSPNQVIQDFDDLLNTGSSGNQFGKFNWTLNNASNAVLVSTHSANPGVLQMQSALGFPTWIALSSYATGTPGGGWILGAGSLSANFVFDLVTLSDNVNTYTTYIGITQDIFVYGAGGTDPSYGIYFKYTDSINGGKWQIICNDGVTATTVDSGVLAATGFHNFGISINASATSVTFTIDGSPVGSPIATNIPTGQLLPAVYTVLSLGTAPIQEFDLFYYTQVLSSPR